MLFTTHRACVVAIGLEVFPEFGVLFGDGILTNMREQEKRKAST